MKIFREQELFDLLQVVANQMEADVSGEDKNQLLNCNEVEYIQYLLSKYTIEPLELDWENKYVTDYEADIPINDYGEIRNVGRQIITYHVPYNGNGELFNFKPSTWIVCPTEININTDMSEISFDIINVRDDLEQIKRDVSRIIENIQLQLANVIKDVERYNNKLESKITEIVRSSKA